MATDVTKHLERAQKYLERNKIQNAIDEYLAVHQAMPANQEVMQSLGDLYYRQNDAVKAAQYYGLLFDRVADANTAKATALYTRFLKPVPQPPERMARFALLLQKQAKRDEAIEHYTAAAELFLKQKRESDALSCWDKIAQLDPENPARHVKVGEVGEQLGKPDIAARGFLRAGQLALADGSLEDALNLLARGHKLLPTDRSVALVYAQALLQKGDGKQAAELLDPFGATEEDPPFQETYGDALVASGRFDDARAAFEKVYAGEPASSCDKLFNVVTGYIQSNHPKAAAELLGSLKERLFAAKKQAEFCALVDQISDDNPDSVELAEVGAKVYSDLNRESKYFEYLVRIFDLYLRDANYQGACEALDRLVDIDPYDFQHQDRLQKLTGHVDAGYIRGVTARMAKAVNVSGQAPMIAPGMTEPSGPPMSEEARSRQALEDLLVQTEIFLQYSLVNKAVERLQKIAEMFPHEVQSNDRLRNLFTVANWWPEGFEKKAAPGAPAAAAAPAVTAAEPSPSKSGIYSADTVRDLTKISEIGSVLYRQTTPKGVLAAVVNEVSKYLRSTRCLAVIGPAGQPPQMVSESPAPGLDPAAPPQVAALIEQLEKMPPDALGGIAMESAAAPVLRELGLTTALAVQLTDKESQSAGGWVILGSGPARQWKPNESYLLQAVGDQALMSVNHTKLRSLVQNMNVADARTGLLSRSSYLDCLLAEWNRARTQNTPLSLLLLQVDRGPELLKQHGEAQIDRYVEKVARAVQGGVRQSDLAVKYTAWALALILPDTTGKNAEALADKLRKVSAGVKPPWNQAPVTVSAAVVEAEQRPDYDAEDIITDLINRAEFALEEARKKGGDNVVAL